MKINKSLVAPIIAVVVLCVKNITGFELPDDQLDVITDGALAILTLIGIFTNPIKDENGDV